MSVPAQKFREIVFQMLYSHDMGKAENEAMLELLTNELAVTKKVVRQAQERAQQIIDRQHKIDDLIAQTSYSYQFERIQSVERNILRLGTFEILFDETIPHKVAIAEAMRLARKFSTKESASFINAILDTIYKSSQGQNIDTNLLKKSAEELAQSEAVAHKASQEKTDNKNGTNA